MSLSLDGKLLGGQSSSQYYFSQSQTQSKSSNPPTVMRQVKKRLTKEYDLKNGLVSPTNDAFSPNSSSFDVLSTQVPPTQIQEELTERMIFDHSDSEDSSNAIMDNEVESQACNDLSFSSPNDNSLANDHYVPFDECTFGISFNFIYIYYFVLKGGML